MGSAILNGWLDQGVKPDNIYLIDRDATTLEQYDAQGVHTYTSVEGVPQDLVFDVFLLALKPQIIAASVDQFDHLISEKTCLVSVAAGVMVQTLKQLLPSAKNVVRVMPNTPAMIGKGVMVGFSHEQDEFGQLVEGLFATLGSFHWINDEEQMHAVTAISGSGPAYLFYFAQCFVESAKTLGLAESLAEQLALETVIGAANLIEQSDDDVETLRHNVTSPNGTTQAGLAALMEGSTVKSRVEACCHAAAKRSVELS